LTIKVDRPNDETMQQLNVFYPPATATRSHGQSKTTATTIPKPQTTSKTSGTSNKATPLNETPPKIENSRFNYFVYGGAALCLSALIILLFKYHHKNI